MTAWAFLVNDPPFFLAPSSAHFSCSFFFLIIGRPPRSPLFPYTPLFRSLVLEPVQGEGGFVDMPADFPRRLKEICEQHGILYVDDEVQAGVGRTGRVWAIEHYGVEDRKSTRLNSSHSQISYAVFCLKKKR